MVDLGCQGVIATDEPDWLLAFFFSQAPVALRWSFWEEVGLDLARAPEPLTLTMTSRLQALWEWRITTLSQESQQVTTETEELAPFRWWFKSGKLPTERSLRQLKATLQLHGAVDARS